MRFYITHTDNHGERHQIGGAYEAASEAEAIAQMLSDAGETDDGNWNAYPVSDETDVIA
jgi:hypothetical protein